MKWCPVLVALERSLLYELPHQLLVCYYSNHICLHIGQIISFSFANKLSNYYNMFTETTNYHQLTIILQINGSIILRTQNSALVTQTLL